jgi:hypothetical protein
MLKSSIDLSRFFSCDFAVFSSVTTVCSATSSFFFLQAGKEDQIDKKNKRHVPTVTISLNLDGSPVLISLLIPPSFQKNDAYEWAGVFLFELYHRAKKTVNQFLTPTENICYIDMFFDNRV